MAAYALMSVGPWVGSTGNVVPTLPDSRGTGNLLLTAVTNNDGTGTLPNSVPGWGNPVFAYPGDIRLGLYARKATADSADTFVGDVSGTAKAHAAMACFTGDVIANINSTYGQSY